MTRYLFFLSYIGTRFRGIQKQISSSSTHLDDPETVQGMLEIALKRLHPVNFPAVYVSSRTDAGVHALRTSIHVDLEREGNGFTTDELKLRINKFFERSDIAIRIQDCCVVPNTFSSRHHAIQRSYLYRFAVRKESAAPLSQKNSTFLAQIPFYEWRRCYFIQKPEFDVDKFRKAASLLLGEKDFRTFMGSAKGQNDQVSSIRLLYNIDISPGQTQNYCPYASYYSYWDVVCTGKSFVYKQVRRMVAVLVAVGQGRLEISDVEHMLAEPSMHSWNPRVAPLPPFGLYLLNVEYNPSDLMLENTSISEKSEGRNTEVLSECLN